MSALFALCLVTTAVGANESQDGPNPSERVLLDRIVATVNDEIVTLSELRAAAEPFLERNKGEKKRKRLAEDVLNRLVEERLVSQQVEEANITATEREIDQQIDSILDMNRITYDELKAAIESYGMTMEKYRAEVKEQVIRRRLFDVKVRSRIIIPEEDLRLEYERRTRNEKPTTKIRIAHIVLPYDEKATDEQRQAFLQAAAEVRDRVTKGGEAFSEVATELSQGPTAKEGGELAEMNFDNLMPELANAVQSLEEGEISPPVLTRSGIQVLKLLERRQELSKSFEEMRAQIYAELNAKRMNDEVQQWIKELRRTSDVELQLEGVKL